MVDRAASGREPAELRESFRIYVFGKLRDAELTIFAEHDGRRVVDRSNMAKHAEVAKLVDDLRGYVDCGTPRSFDEDAIRQLGTALYQMVVPPLVHNLLSGIAAERQDRAIELFVENPELAGWPWEYLYDTARARFLCVSHQPVSRGIFTLNPAFQPRETRTPVKLLLVLAVPLDDPTTPAAEEKQLLDEVFTKHLGEAEVDIDILVVASPREFHDKLATGDFDIVHFYGHGRFDAPTRQGRLRFERPGNEPSEVSAEAFANLFIGRNVRMVFLNACNTARAGDNVNPAISSLAAALLDRGIAAVVATQFPMPVFAAPFLSSAIYRELALGRSLIEAVGQGRQALELSDAKRAHDWGIPVLFSSLPSLTLFRPAAKDARRRRSVAKGVSAATPPPSPRIESTVTVDKTSVSGAKTSVRECIGLADLDAQVGFLSDLAAQANAVQGYFHFQVSYLQLPAGVIRSVSGREPQLYAPALHDYFRGKPAQLGVDRLVGLTRHMISDVELGEKWYNLISTSIEEHKVALVSTYQLRDWASQAGTSFTKAVLFAALAQLISEMCQIVPHPETVGCPFDFCETRSDMVRGLRKSKLEHPICRDAIRDERLREAFDQLLAMPAGS